MQPNAKALILLGDGLGDRPCKELGNKTPLESAHKPHMNRLAREGENGYLDPIAPGIRAGSDTAHLAILGYDPYEVYTGRGPFEAFGIGMDLQPGDLAFRANFATVDENFTVLDRRAGRISEGTQELASALNGLQIEDITFFCKESVAHRAGLVMRGPSLSDKITEADPHTEGLKVQEVKALLPEAEKTARILNAFIRKSYEVLREHPVNQARAKAGLKPANILLPRGQGFAPHLGNFTQRYGLTAACIVEVGLVKGIGRYVGMEVIDVPGATGGLDTDTQAIGRAVIENLATHDFLLCNVKGPDVAGHDRDPHGKIAIIEKIDAMLGDILNHLPGPTYIILTGDHTTPVTFGDHTGDPVPMIIWGPEVRPDGVTEFGERPSSQGSLGRLRGKDLMNIITSYLGVQEKFGA